MIWNVLVLAACALLLLPLARWGLLWRTPSAEDAPRDARQADRLSF